ncbi:MAG: hypothetical protein F4030_02745 [Gammaproteobacteria bacterium]|nr:hypothetical protein [Gammaproteobacteria bacterium]MYH84992.1 hypothetical protein [Gammaproteobacteria bacterium]MYK03893.1 hypothetical protein [Gammaproteobacteria bacterium]
MAARLADRFGVSARLIESGGGRFDVHVDGSLAYSKHETGEFPDEARLVSEIARKFS